MLGVLAPTAHAGTWYATGTVVNTISSSAQTCPSATDGTPWGCITVSNAAVDDGNWVVEPTAIPRSGVDSMTFQFIAPNLDQGADGSFTAATPDGTLWGVKQFDDINGFTGNEWNYTSACQTNISEPPPQYLCVPAWNQWSTSAANIQAAWYFTDPGATPSGMPGAGATCSSTMEPGDSTSCIPGQFGQLDNTNYRGYLIENTGSQPVDIQLQGNQPVDPGLGGDPTECELTTLWSNCTLTTSPGEVMNIAPGSGASSSQQQYSVELTAVTLIPPNVASEVGAAELVLMLNSMDGGGDGGDDDALGAARRGPRPRALNVHTRQRPVVTYRARRRGGDTVFTVARLRGRGRHPRVVQLGHRTRGTRQGGRRQPQLFGHFAHRDHKGHNRVTFPRRIAGRRLTLGHYRLVAQTRHGTATGLPATTGFRIR